MTKSDDSRMELEAEYRVGVERADFQPDMQRRLLAPERLAELSDRDLGELIDRYGSSEARPAELLRLEKAKSPGFSGEPEQGRQARYDAHWLRYIICGGAPLGAFLFLFIARHYSEELDLKQINLNLDDAVGRLMKVPPDDLAILSGRVTWSVFDVLFYAAVCATAYFGILYIIPKALDKHLKFYKIILLAIVIPLAALGFGSYNNKFQHYLSIPTKLFELTINNNYGPTSCYRFPFSHDPKPIIQCKMESDEFWVYATHAFLAFLCIVIIYGGAQDTKRIAEPEADLNRIEARLLLYMKLLRISLYLGAAVLVTEILNVSALLHWPLAYLNTQGGVYAGSIDNLLSALIAERAINYTGFLALLYIPSFLVFREDAYRVACRQLPDKSLADREAWLKEQGVAFSIWEYLPRIVAILGPLLSTPISELIRHASNLHF